MNGGMGTPRKYSDRMCRSITVGLCMFLLSNICVLSMSWGVEGLVKQRRDARIITVGGPGADLPAFTSEAVQIAIDALGSKGGGTVRLGAGTFAVSAPISLSDHVSLTGAGPSTILRKVDGFRTKFVIDADYGMLKVVVKDPSGFKTGMGIQLWDDDHTDCWDATTARITSINADTLYIDTWLVHDYLAGSNGTISNSCPVVEGIGVEHVRIADFTVDGNGSTNDPMTGCRGGGVYFHKSRDITMERVRVHHFNGDNFSWQITEQVSVLQCESDHASGLGFHPGTGSDATRIEDCRCHDNKGDGIFLCWRVQNGVFRNNEIFANGQYGISIGHKDTDNLFENNRVYGNGSHGVYFREESEENGGHRNVFKRNTVEDNGVSVKPAYGFYIGGTTHDILIENTIVRSTGKGHQAGAIFLGKNASKIVERNNTFAGHPGVVREGQ